MRPIPTADPRLLLARRIDAGLERQLGMGIELPRLLGSALYARDVLLVCQAYPDTELPELALQFRVASAGAAAANTSAPASGFDSSTPADSAPGGAERPDSRARRWHNPSSWFGR